MKQLKIIVQKITFKKISLCQRESNEYANGLLGEYFPKKTDLAVISDETLNKGLYDINYRLRKCLAYRTAYEALVDELE